MHTRPMHAAVRLITRFLPQVLRAALVCSAGLAILWAFTHVGGRLVQRLAHGAIQVELTIMHWGDKDEGAIIAALVAEFEQQHPHIRVRRIPAGIYHDQKLKTMMAAGTPPDLFYLGSENLAFYAGRALLRTLDDLANADHIAGRAALNLDDFYPQVLDCFRYDGTQVGTGPLYGLPISFTTIGIYYNRDLFRRAGLPEPAPGWTWEQFATAARALGQLTDDAGQPCYGAEFVTWPAMMQVYLRSFGLDFATPDFRSYHLTEPPVLAALERIHRWRFAEQRALTDARSQVQLGSDLFQAGRVGMIGPLGRWVVARYRQTLGFDWDFAPLPRGTQEANVILTTSWSMARSCRHPEAAWLLLQHLTGPVGATHQARTGLGVPALRPVATAPVFLDDPRPPRNNAAYLNMIPAAQLPNWPLDSRYQAELMTYLEGAYRSGEPVPAMMAAVERIWQRLDGSPLRSGAHAPVPWRAILTALALSGTALLTYGVWCWQRGRPGPRARLEERAGLGFISPWLLGFALLTAFPIGLSLLLAFSRWTGVLPLGSAEWVGLQNFRELLFHDEVFRKSLRVTGFYVLLAVPGGQLVALGAALLMNSEVRGIGFYRSAWYLPSVLAGVGVAVLWRWVFDGQHGLLNALLEPLFAVVGWLLQPLLGTVELRPPDWLNRDAAWFGPPAFALMHLWVVGGSMMIYLAGLTGIPRTLYEAAEIDGASPARRFWNVTLPMLSPVIFFNGIMAIIGSFQVFTQAYVMTRGGPQNHTMFYVLYLYNQAFQYHEMGYASALAWLLLLIILALTLLVMRGSRRFVYYEALRT